MNELKLKAYREKLKMSQRDVAGAMGIAQAHYWKWETGKSFPNAKQILQLCEIFKCSPNDLFGFKGVYKIVGSNLDE
ncbi:MAG: helix-turn-helix domain-containing protein [Acholeplasmataceae bacterium]